MTDCTYHFFPSLRTLYQLSLKTLHSSNEFSLILIFVIYLFLVAEVCSSLSELAHTCQITHVYASVKGNLELPLLKGRRRFDVETTSNLEVYIFRGW